MCCAPCENDEPTVGECPDCGGGVDKDGDTTETCCYYSPTVCETCGWSPCDLSC